MLWRGRATKSGDSNRTTPTTNNVNNDVMQVGECITGALFRPLILKRIRYNKNNGTSPPLLPNTALVYLLLPPTTPAEVKMKVLKQLLILYSEIARSQHLTCSLETGKLGFLVRRRL